MILLLLTAILFLHSDALRSHLSDNAKLKCDALPFRSIYKGDRCYFAILNKVQYRDASGMCSRSLKGAKAAQNAPSDVFDGLMVTKSGFHLDSSSSGAKNVICSYDSSYKCEADSEFHSGRCLVRAAKTMNFPDAEKYCTDRGMALPAPTNDLDNRLVRDILSKNPAYVQKKLIRHNNQIKWYQENSYSRWAMCYLREPRQNRLWAGNEDLKCPTSVNLAVVIDRNGYWKSGMVTNLMDVVCVTNANNDFTKGESDQCAAYHDDFDGKKLLPLTAPADANSFDTGECYVSTRTTTRYEVLERAKVESPRGCEVLCTIRVKCAAFAYKEAGLSSPCTLLTSKSTTQVCGNPTTIFKKTKTGCPARTNITAEFDNDPCIDRIVPNAFLGVGRYGICNKKDGDDFIVIRVVDFNGRRLTLDNDHNNFIDISGTFWRYRFDRAGRNTVIPFVALACVVADDDKCPCKDKLTVWGPQPPVTEAIPNVLNACGRNAYLHTMVAKMPGYSWVIQPYDTLRSHVTCHAGMWLVYEDSVKNTFGVTGIACV